VGGSDRKLDCGSEIGRGRASPASGGGSTASTRFAGAPPKSRVRVAAAVRIRCAARRTRRDVSTAETITWMNASVEHSREGDCERRGAKHGHNPVAATNRHGRCGRGRPHNVTGLWTEGTERGGSSVPSNISVRPGEDQSFFRSGRGLLSTSRINRYPFASLDHNSRTKFREVNYIFPAVVCYSGKFGDSVGLSDTSPRRPWANEGRTQRETQFAPARRHRIGTISKKRNSPGPFRGCRAKFQVTVF
jgi:hypothetical protein